MVYLIDISADIGGLQGVLRQVYNTMIVHCSDLIGISSAIAGFGTLWYVAAHVWMKISKAQPVEMEALYRPFAIGIAIALWPYVIGLINGVMEPTVTGTAAIYTDANQGVATLLQQKEQALEQSSDWQMYVGSNGGGSLDKWEELSGEADSGMFSGLSNRVKFEMAKTAYNLRNSVKVWLSEILQVLYEAAALCINTVRTFYLVILAILGPLALAFSVYRGLEDSISQWFSRYLHVFLWLPVANIFGSLIAQIQQEMIKLDIAQLSATGQTTFGATDAAYLVFLLMGIVGYFTVPSVTHYIIRSAGMGARLWRTRLT
ncbi:conjugative transposon protein TraJ [Puia dinghuensis]|uniref:Conjugative transposon protein TraJ n=1 Tax=Puia dinghuensis TaxID=1792502 RepID=A0A8J2UIT1_9BACT|nr:conjugative transposon protein TraJ [Puia dinghuensis]GGB23892.1 conjugative transposon protein TraJ [Puia dinghuensis]